MTKIVWLSDFDFVSSGYFNISTNICVRLHELGYELYVVGLGYNGEQHNFPFHLIPARDYYDAVACVISLSNLEKFDALIVALDIPMQKNLLMSLKKRPFKYIGIMPVESDPLSISWGSILLEMDKRLIISEFGVQEAKNVGVQATYIPIGIDTQAWRVPTKEEKIAIREKLGISEDTFVIFTVADNQERKNLSKAFEVVGEFAKDVPNISYNIVTRVDCPVGWDLDDLALKYNLHQKFMKFNRGMGFKELWSLYASSDCFLLSSKCEGLGLPLVEAMAVGLPCVAVDCTGMKELLADGRGYLAKSEYSGYLDPFGNSKRYFMDTKDAVLQLKNIYGHDCQDMIQKARGYAESRTWDDTVLVVDNAIKEVTEKNEPKA